MRVFKNRWSNRFAREERISDAALREFISRAERGLIDADLGGGLIKQRVARPGSGASGGYRTLILFRSCVRAIFAYGFARSARDNIGDDDEAELRRAAKLMLGFSEAEIDELASFSALIEVENGGEEEPNEGGHERDRRRDRGNAARDRVRPPHGKLAARPPYSLYGQGRA